MKKLELQRKVDVVLMPGRLCVAWNPRLIKTILGSCVSLVFFSRRHQVSAISHAQLPSRQHAAGACAGTCPVPCAAEDGIDTGFSYVACSTEYILAQLRAKGILEKDLEIKLFGGASVLAQSGNGDSVGDRNVAAAYQVIEKYGLRLVGQDTGGNKGRTLFLASGTGEVWVYKNG